MRDDERNGKNQFEKPETLLSRKEEEAVYLEEEAAENKQRQAAYDIIESGASRR